MLIENLISLGLLVLLQAVLGFDNLLYISIESQRAPAAQRAMVRRAGILIAVALVISGWVLWWGRSFAGWWGQLLVALIVGGALGNTVDRLRYGAVADFLNMSCCGLRNPFSFNVADIAIFVGALGLVLFSERLERKT